MRPAVFTFAATGRDTVRRIAEAIAGEVIDDPSPALARLFAEGRPLIGVCASGILIRRLAPLLANKHSEPPVIAVSQDGTHVVPLLGGHHGANRLAREVAGAIGGTAALTTASDLLFGRALDDPPPGFRLDGASDVRAVMAKVLAGQAIRLDGEAQWVAGAGYAVRNDGEVAISVSYHEPPPPADLVYRPQVLVAGVGCERGTAAAEIVDLVGTTLSQAGLSPLALAAIGSIDLKADEAGLLEAADILGVPLRLFPAAELAAERERLANPSPIVEAETGTPGVAEAVALKAGTLLVEKQKSRRATCAIGLAPQVIDADGFGRAPGVLHIVGIGPGDRASRTASAVAGLEASTDWVGYGLYLDLVADLRHGRSEHRFPLGEEEARTRHALELAAHGRTVSLVCSGDGQIFAMASLVYELLEASGARALSADARRVAVVSHPGISALQAASAAAGALLGHDFCAISLSDLLTPRATILSRLEAAARGDFVTALYNPRSRRRIDLLAAAHRLFRDHRPPETPVIVARDLGRSDERVTVTTLAAFDPETVDMLTIVLFGASQSRAFVRGNGEAVAYTPRGYDLKAEAAE